MQKFILNIIKKAGKRLLKYYGKIDAYEIKGDNPTDIVTIADKAIEEFVVSAIKSKFNNHTIIGEEGSGLKGTEDSVWYIDPIDGTTNFFHKLPFFGISIAYQEEGILKDGAIFFPVLNELFWASKGKGAFMNGKRIAVSNISDIKESLLATGFACLRSGLKNNNIENAIKVLELLHDFRRTGSACYDLCSVACGRIDGFWEINLSSWDVAAGALIVQEAGGKVTDFNGGSEYIKTRRIVATNGKIHEALLKLLHSS